VLHYFFRQRKTKGRLLPKRIFKVSYSSGPVWINITRPIFTDNVGIVQYRPPLIDGMYLNNGRHYDFEFTAVDASGNSAVCKLQVIVGGKKQAYILKLYHCLYRYVVATFLICITIHSNVSGRNGKIARIALHPRSRTHCCTNAVARHHHQCDWLYLVQNVHESLCQTTTANSF